MLLAFVLVATAPIAAVSEAQSGTSKSSDAPEFRAPFTLKLHVDKEHFYEEKFKKMPYVHQNDVYLFKDDAFGIDLHIGNGKITKVTYQANQKKADVALKFTQEVRTNGEAMMTLVIKNQSTNKLFIDAPMTVPGKEGVFKTSIVPLLPRLDYGEPWSGYESWPHPIVQLVLRDFRLNEKSDNEKKVESDRKPKGSPP